MFKAGSEGEQVGSPDDPLPERDIGCRSPRPEEVRGMCRMGAAVHRGEKANGQRAQYPPMPTMHLQPGVLLLWEVGRVRWTGYFVIY